MVVASVFPGQQLYTCGVAPALYTAPSLDVNVPDKTKLVKGLIVGELSVYVFHLYTGADVS